MEAMARRVAWALAPVVACLSAGCFLPSAERGAAPGLVRMRPEISPDVVIMHIALIERALGEPFINQELWQHTDQFVVDLERKAVLEENGLRVGQVVGVPPAELQHLLTSQRWCVARHRVLPAGHTHTQPVGPVHPHCEYDLFLGRKPLDVQVDQARFCFDMTATHAADGKTRLQFVPKVETGEQVLPFQPDPGQSNWVYRIERPAKSYPELSWDVKLRPNEFIIIGANLTKENTLGYRALVDAEGPEPVQRLLVIRTARSLQNADEDPALEELARTSASPPLALQATLGAVRASRP
jgi:hypothetical protein